MTSLRAATLKKAMAAGKHIFTEKPTAETLEEAVELAGIARDTGVTAGVVHDKLFLPGLVKLRRLVDEGFFGRILSLRGEFGYWVFEGDVQSGQRPSWNYRREDGGGITTDMFCHWNYVLEGIIGKVKSVNANTVTHIPTRWDEQGNEYRATADDAAYGIFELETPNGDQVVGQINSSWAVRVYRDELVEFQVGGNHGSAVAGLTKCVAQQRAYTPRPVWNPDLPPTESFRSQWQQVPANADLDNGFKRQWEEFLADVIAGREHRFGSLTEYLLGEPGLWSTPSAPIQSRSVYAAAHVVPAMLADNTPGAPAMIDWETTLAYRHELWSYGLGVADAMDTAQRGMGLDWAATQELIKRSAAEAASVGGVLACGAGTDQLDPATVPAGKAGLETVLNAYREQIALVAGVGATVIVMASRALAQVATSADDFLHVYSTLLAEVDEPVIVHWLGTMFDPALAGYWGSDDIGTATGTFTALVAEQPTKVAGVKVSLLDAGHEVALRARLGTLPHPVRVYTGDDFNYPELIDGDGQHHSDALLGIFAAIYPAASAALQAYDAGEADRGRTILDSTQELGKHIFGPPTFYYKTGIAFMSWLNGKQTGFAMVGGLQAGRSLPHLVRTFRLADRAGLLLDPELAAGRMSALLAVNGLGE